MEYDCLISVGICTYNQKDLCRNLVRDLFQYGPQDMKVFVWDNNPHPLMEFNDPRVEVIPDENNSGYIKPNNRMATACRSQYHVVSNDDVEVGPKWFESCIKEFDDRVACVGAVGQYGYLDNNFQGQAAKSRNYDYIEGWWMMFPRHIIERYGWVFDEENLRFATCEDSHTCLLLQEHGWKIKILKNLPVKHLESMTKKSLKITNWGDDNRRWLKKRWKTYLETRKFTEHIILVSGEHVSKKKLKEIRWKYPYSKIVLSLDKSVVDEVVWESGTEHSMEI